MHLYIFPQEISFQKYSEMYVYKHKYEAMLKIGPIACKNILSESCVISLQNQIKNANKPR